MHSQDGEENDAHRKDKEGRGGTKKQGQKGAAAARKPKLKPSPSKDGSSQSGIGTEFWLKSKGTYIPIDYDRNSSLGLGFGVR